MVETQRPEDVAAYNERSLKALDRAIALSQGEFSLVLVRCNYEILQKQIVHQLRELSEQRYQIRELVLPEWVKTLYTTIQTYRHCQPDAQTREYRGDVGDVSEKLTPSPSHSLTLSSKKPHPTLLIFGLESVVALDDLFASTNQVRDEFRKRLPFPIVLWMNDEVLQKFVRFAPDFASWAATPIKFEISTSNLLDFLRQTAAMVFNTFLKRGGMKEVAHDIPSYHSLLNLTAGSRHRLELDCALQDLQRRGVSLEAELDACLEFVFGLDDYVSDRIDDAIGHYQISLRFWRQINDLERQGLVLFHLGLCYCRYADQHRAERYRNWEEAWPYLNQCIEVLTQARRSDLVAQFVTPLAAVLQHLEAWSSLQALALQSVPLHQTYGSSAQLAQDYGFLAEVALQQSRWDDASQLAEKALFVLAESGETHYHGLHRFLLAQLYQLFLVKAQRQLGHRTEAHDYLETASQELERAIKSSDHRYETQHYLHLLEALRSLYFEQGRYLEAFRIKQEQRVIEQLYGFRAFIGAGRLQPQRPITKGEYIGSREVPPERLYAQEIAASGRQRDVNRLIERISRADHKLTVIHGQSGVGKSSIVAAGLMPALKHRAIGDRIALPIVLQVYTDWVRDLGRAVTQALDDFGLRDGEGELASGDWGMATGNSSASSLDSSQISNQEKIQKLLAQLRQNAEQNLLTVLIFDQFEEFIFASTNQSQKLLFYEFIRDCLNLGFIKVILSVREDYLHFLLEIEQFVNLEVIDNNILDKKIRYSLGNFSLEDANAVIQSLTERAHFYLEPALIDELVRDLAGELGTVRPIELQVVGAQLQAENITTLAQYQQAGPKQRLVERFVEKVVKDCGPENENAAWVVLYLLTDENNNRPFKTPAELAAESGIEPQKLNLILEILEKSGLLFLVPEVPTNRYQLIHDYLVGFIRQKEQFNIKIELEELRKREKLSQDEIEQLRAELREKELRSRLAEATEKQRSTEDKLNQVLKRSLQRARLVGAALFTLTLIAGGLWQQASINESEARLSALNASSKALVASGRKLDALIESIRAGQKLKGFISAKPKTRMQAVAVLQQLVYGVKEYNRLEGHTGWVSSVSFSPDGKRIASASEDKTLKLWKADGTLLDTLSGHEAGVYSVSFSPDGKLIASASKDSTVKLWSSEGELLNTLRGHGDRVHSLSFSPDGKRIASASEDKTVKLWSTDGTLLKTLRGHFHWVLGVSFSPNGQLIASASRDNTIKLWSNEGVLLKTWKAHNGAVTSVSFSPDGKAIASAGADNTVKLWRFDGTLIQTFKGHSNAVINVSFSPDGKTIASGSKDNTINLWHLDGTLIESLKGHGNSVQGVSFSPDGKTIASASADYTVKLWSSDGGMLKPITGHTDTVSSVSFSPDGEKIATASWDRTIRLWSKAGVPLKAFQAHDQPITGVSFSPDGKAIATASEDQTVKLWTTDGMLLRTLSGHTAAVLGVSFSPDGKRIASASEDQTVKLWTTDGTLLETLSGHTAKVWGVSFSPDGQMIATASEDKTVKLWNRKGKLLNTLNGQNASVNWVSFSPDSQLIAIASGDGTIRLWKRDGTPHTPPLKLHNASVNWVSFSPDGQVIASASEDHTVNLWSKDGDFINTLEGHKASVFGVSFSPDGKILASVSEDKTLILWNLDLDKLLSGGCSWLSDYLKNPARHSVSEASPSDSRPLCKGIIGSNGT